MAQIAQKEPRTKSYPKSEQAPITLIKIEDDDSREQSSIQSNGSNTRSINSESLETPNGGNLFSKLVSTQNPQISAYINTPKQDAMQDNVQNFEKIPSVAKSKVVVLPAVVEDTSLPQELAIDNTYSISSPHLTIDVPTVNSVSKDISSSQVPMGRSILSSPSMRVADVVVKK